MAISILGIDIGQNSCSVVGVDDKGAVTVRRTMRRQTLIDFVSKIPTCIIAMEACLVLTIWVGFLGPRGTRSD